MRYPGRHRHESLWRGLALLVSLTIFLAGLILVQGKNNPDPKAASQVTRLPSPTPFINKTSPSPATVTTRLKMVDGITGWPLAGQSIAILAAIPCFSSSPCPATTPMVLTADGEGLISLDQSIIQNQPKFYAAGYQLDSYFAFLNPDRPTELTLYKSLPDLKKTYDIMADVVTIGLTPIK